MTATEVPNKVFQRWLDLLPDPLEPNPATAVLQSYGDRMLDLAQTITWSTEPLRAAREGEELLYSLAKAKPSGISLYLVSDGPGVTSPPHEHTTWAVIVGLRGIERNVMYRQVNGRPRTVAAIDQRDVGAGECITLSQDAIHATSVIGEHATFHLHLYGRPLNELAPFENRTYCASGAA